MMDVVSLGQLREILGAMAQSNAQAAQGVPSHDSYFSPEPAIP
jgi:hypothetical protein